ncbi:hypothetical protein H5410_053826 [Solanum commersonii]|uniref:DUF4283 domain-containing protein n=1 Tax=Solanum commersonii TaxID=4109 RepID=A0A9J5X608_SOLCO|nr:hypothetical protein H5410_053826 [Solanum commersonii]
MIEQDLEDNTWAKLMRWETEDFCLILQIKPRHSRIVGLPLHLWSEKIFKVIRDSIGGWVETEEEMKLHNHLKWARISVRGDGFKIPKEVTIVSAGIAFSMQLWTELPARINIEEDKGQNYYPLSFYTMENSNLNLGLPPAGKGKGKGPMLSTLKSPNSISKEPNQKIVVSRGEHVSMLEGIHELRVLAFKFLKVFEGWEGMAETHNTTNLPEEVNEGEKINLCLEDEADERKEVCNEIQTEREEEEPVNIQTPFTQEEAESDASNWVNFHILEMSNTYGVAFEKETLELLMRIDERKSVLDKKGQAKTNSTSKSKGIGKNELKNIKSCLNEKVNIEGEI